MSTGSNYANTSVASRPIIAPGATAQSYYPITYASAAYPELAAPACPPQAKRPQIVARSARKYDRALFPAIRFALKPAQLREALLNVLLVGGAIGLIVTVAAAAFIAPYILFFVET